MPLDYLDQMIPKRWVLLIRYWLPFLKTPRTFYFKCRIYIDNLKPSDYKYFSWKKFPNLLAIFEKHAFDINEKKIARKIISQFFTKEYKQITLEFLISIFTQFDPDNKNTLLDEVLKRIPNKFYLEYFNTLNIVNCSERNLKWCARLKDKFQLEDKLSLFLSLSDETLSVNQSTLFTLAVQECEDKLLIDKLALSNFLSAYVIEQLLAFIFSRNPRIIFSHTFIDAFINQLLETQHPILASHILELDEHARYSFLETFLAYSPNFYKNTQYFLSLCPEKQWLNLINQLITSVFNANQSEMHDETLKENKPTADNLNLILLSQLNKHYTDYPINLFQFLAIQSLTKESLDINPIKKFFELQQSSLEYRKNFPIACQSAVVEYTVLAIKIFIKDNFLLYVHKENTRNDIHRAFYQFFDNDYIGKPLNVAKLILKKIPQHLQAKCEADLDFLQQLLSQLYLILDDPDIIEYKNKCFLVWNKNQREYEERSKARRELLQRIRDGKQSSVASQRMEELFGSEAAIMQAKWKQLLGVHFFDATNKEECQAALY